MHVIIFNIGGSIEHLKYKKLLGKNMEKCVLS